MQKSWSSGRRKRRNKLLGDPGQRKKVGTHPWERHCLSWDRFGKGLSWKREHILTRTKGSGERGTCELNISWNLFPCPPYNFSLLTDLKCLCQMLCIFLVLSLSNTRISLLDKVQLTVEQYRFELQGPPYTQIFVNEYCTIVLHNSKLVESPDVELWIRRANCKVTLRLLTTWWLSAPNVALFKGQL